MSNWEFIPQQYFNKSESVEEHLESLYKQSEATTNPTSYFRYTEMNQRRMRRLLKRDRWSEKELDKIDPISKALSLLVITEHWCGDAANSLPYIFQLADHFDLLKVSILYRDQNPQLMDAFLTEGTRSIPKVIAAEPKSGRVIHSWGPRPEPLQEKIRAWKRDPEMHSETRAYLTQKWYVEDKGQKLKDELIQFLNRSLVIIDSIDHMSEVIRQED